MGILEKEQEKRQGGKGTSELNADRWSAVMSGDSAEPNWQIESSVSRYIRIGPNRLRVPPIVTRQAGLQSRGRNRFGHFILTFAQKAESLEVLVKKLFQG